MNRSRLDRIFGLFDSSDTIKGLGCRMDGKARRSHARQNRLVVSKHWIRRVRHAQLSVGYILLTDDLGINMCDGMKRPTYDDGCCP